jgi:hypothetical protein
MGIVANSDDKLAFNLDVSDLSDGVFFAEINADSITKSIKFIVKK